MDPAETRPGQDPPRPSGVPGPRGPATDRTLSLPAGGAASAMDAPAEPHERIGPYEILGPLAHGGMGMVYRARDPKLGREVAVKVLAGGAWAGPDLQQRFLREAKVLAELSHPGIVPIHDTGLDGRTPFYAMDLVEGLILTEHVRSRGLSLSARLRIFLPICDAVQHAHMKGIIHRDLKPSNILVRSDGSPVVLDFGLARLIEQEPGEGLTMSGAVMGTPLYMAPEQARGETARIDVRTDVYALGTILYELAADRPPFTHRDSLALLRAVAEEEPRPPSAVRKGIPKDLEAVILKAMAKDQDRRYRSADALGEDVRRYLEGRAVSAHPDSSLYRLRKWIRRHKELSGTLAAATLLVCLAFWRAVEERSQAIVERNKAVDAERKAETALEESKRLLADQERRIRADLLLSSIQYLSLKHDLEEKLRIAKEVIRLVPDHPHAYFVLGETYRTLLEPENTIAAYREAIRCNPDLTIAYRYCADALRGSGRTQEAAEVLKSLLTRKPDMFKAYPDLLSLARDLRRSGRAAEALACLEGLPPSPQLPAGTEADLKTETGFALGALGRHAEAYDLFDGLMRSYGDVNAAVRLGRGMALEGLGRTREAVEDFRFIIDHRRQSRELLIARERLDAILKSGGGLPE